MFILAIRCNSLILSGSLVFLSGYVRERSEKVHATIPRVIVGGFKFTVVQRNLK